MNKFSIFVFFIIALSLGQCYEVIENEQGKQYYLVPLQRQRRQTTFGVGPGSNGGFRVAAGHQGTIFNQNGNRLDGGGILFREFGPAGPPTVGANLAYSHQPSGSYLNVAAQQTRGFGTDFHAQARANLYRQGNTRLDAVYDHRRHYGGIQGTGRPDYYVGLDLTLPF